MKFIGQHEETLFVSEILPEQRHIFDKQFRKGLCIIWNKGNPAHFNIDKQSIKIETDNIIFITEYHQIENFCFEKLNLIQFNRHFYCLENHDDDIGCKGMLFYGASDIPNIAIPNERKEQFNFIWDSFLMEIKERDNFTLDILQTLLKRFLILSVRVYKNNNLNLPVDNANLALIREFNYLVEKNFKTLHKVSEYAALLNKSPKTLSNLFTKHIDKTPLQIINDRKMLEAKRMLTFTNTPIQEIAGEMNFNDLQAFSHFFKTREGVSPSQYRENTASKEEA
jgi:AraC-like DNA-binding protein